MTKNGDNPPFPVYSQSDHDFCSLIFIVSLWNTLFTKGIYVFHRSEHASPRWKRDDGVGVTEAGEVERKEWKTERSCNCLFERIYNIEVHTAYPKLPSSNILSTQLPLPLPLFFTFHSPAVSHHPFPSAPPSLSFPFLPPLPFFLPDLVYLYIVQKCISLDSR